MLKTCQAVKTGLIALIGVTFLLWMVRQQISFTVDTKLSSLEGYKPVYAIQQGHTCNDEKPSFPVDEHGRSDFQSNPSKREIAETLESRAVDISRLCDNLHRLIGNAKVPTFNTGRLIYLKQQRILYCPIEKIASTFWKQIFYAITKNDDVNDTFEINPGQALSFQGDKINNSDEVSSIAENTTSFLFVRDPFSRLFSGWLDKFFSLNTYYWKGGRKIIAAERMGASERDLNCGHDVSFSEFVNFETKKIVSGKGTDGHFSPIVSLCNVCNLRFKSIGKYETLKNDTKFIMNATQIAGMAGFTDNFAEKSIKSMIIGDANFVFSQRNSDMMTSCFSFQCSLFRVWKRFACRGFISKRVPFPYSSAERAANLTKEEFINDAVNAHKNSDHGEIENNRNEVLAEAYSSLSKETFDRMLTAFGLDFYLFGYHRNPEFLKLSYGRQQNLNEKYLEKCPFQE